ncbi:hypothetical protein SeMB42_g04214 [Synchytrium endobioticum]|uniref:Uncharacterized protein n=1 Tax=Synchytrium endobioticum TaxID=286115 RepID=A0A507CIP2_9FUNG|nr:hypothetical protein SeLEV6574_g07202 [Synchytrium endobioticum]TPX44756.1 hypothetical protein SeMB42_g04214 [Synchytrium endobioticum]
MPEQRPPAQAREGQVSSVDEHHSALAAHTAAAAEPSEYFHRPKASPLLDTAPIDGQSHGISLHQLPVPHSHTHSPAGNHRASRQGDADTVAIPNTLWRKILDCPDWEEPSIPDTCEPSPTPPMPSFTKKSPVRRPACVKPVEILPPPKKRSSYLNQYIARQQQQQQGLDSRSDGAGKTRSSSRASLECPTLPTLSIQPQSLFTMIPPPTCPPPPPVMIPYTMPPMAPIMSRPLSTILSPQIYQAPPHSTSHPLMSPLKHRGVWDLPIRAPLPPITSTVRGTRKRKPMMKIEKLGTLGPDRFDDEHLSKLRRAAEIKQYAQQVREQNAKSISLSRQSLSRATPDSTQHRPVFVEGQLRRQLAPASAPVVVFNGPSQDEVKKKMDMRNKMKDYAAHVPKPQVTPSSTQPLPPINSKSQVTSRAQQQKKAVPKPFLLVANESVELKRLLLEHENNVVIVDQLRKGMRL